MKTDVDHPAQRQNLPASRNRLECRMLRQPKATSPARRPPHVAVIVPCFNYGRYLEDCVQSIISQPGVTTEVHILDDASTDGSQAFAESLANRYSRVRLTTHSANMGHIATYNEGLSQVDSDYVVLLSADDLLAPGSLGRATALMEEFPAVGLVYGHPQAFTALPVQGTERARNWSVWTGHEWIYAQFRRGLSIISSPEAVVRTSVQHQVGYYRPELPHTADLEMWLRIADVSSVGRVNGVDQAFHRIHETSMMHTRYGALLDDLEERVMAYDTFLEHTSLAGKLSSKLRETVSRRMAIESLEWAAQEALASRPEAGLISRALQFAGRVYPNFVSLNAYQDFLNLSPDGLRVQLDLTDTPTKRLRAWQGAIERDLGSRLRWRRWRTYGI